MSRTRRFLGGVSLGYIYQALLMLAGLWLTPFLLSHIGQNDYGLWLVGTQIMFYLGLMDFGVVALLPRETAYSTGRASGINEAKDLPDIIGRTARLVLWQMPFVILLAVISWLTMPAEWEALNRPLGLVIFAFVLLFPLRVFPATLQGLQDLAFLGKVQICGWAFSTAVTAALILMGLGLHSLAIGWAINQAVSTLACWLRLRARFPNVLPARLPGLSWAAARSLLTRGSWISVAQVAQLLLSGTDILIIGKLLGPVAVVPYACTGKLISVLANQPQLLMQSAFPALSEMRMGESRQRMFQVCAALGQAMLIVSGGVVCVVLVVNRGFVGWWIGADQYAGSALTAVLLLSMMLRQWNTTWIYALLCFGHERRISLTNLLDGAVNVCASVVLIWALGLKGAPLGAVIGVCLVSLPGNLSAMARELEVPVANLIKMFWPWTWRFLMLVLATGSLGASWTPGTFIEIAAAASAAALAYCAVMLPMALGSSLGDYIRPRLAFMRMKLAGALRPDHMA
jgi:O-antigen/teichoic acid export membrane protein